MKQRVTRKKNELCLNSGIGLWSGFILILKDFFFFINLFMRNARFCYIIYFIFIFAVMDYLLKEEIKILELPKIIGRKILL